MIPKIVHQSAPKSKLNWHYIWEECHLSWKNHFPQPEYCHFLWDDESINEFIKEKFNQYWNLYNQFPFHILKLDFFRYCVLYEYGGIYADMDMYCYKNFYDELNGDLFLVESLSFDEMVQNSLMCSSPRNSFFIECLEEIKNKFYSSIFYDERYKDTQYQLEFKKTFLFSFTVKKVTGPYLLSEVYKKSKLAKQLNYKQYNNINLLYEDSYITKHMLTGKWGKDFDNNEIRYYPSKFDFKKNYITDLRDRLR